MRNHYLVAGVMAVALATLASFPANATLTISATFGAASFTCVDNTACDSNAAIGTIALSTQTIGGVTVEGSIQRSQGTPGNPAPLDILNTSSLSVINTLGTSVIYNVLVRDNDFAAPVATYNLSGAGTWENAVGSTATMTWYADPLNSSSGPPQGIVLDTFSSTAVLIADGYAHTGAGPLNFALPFSMAERITGTLTGNASLLNRGQTVIASPVPEPATLTILGAGLIGLAALRRKRA